MPRRLERRYDKFACNLGGQSLADRRKPENPPLRRPMQGAEMKASLFGREPALVISVIGSLVTLLVALNIPGLSAGAGAAITTFVTAVIIAATTRPIAPALFTAIVSAGAALFAEYGLSLSDHVVAALSAVILSGFTLFGIRPQVTPTRDSV
jgi:hypothetical protein